MSPRMNDNAIDGTPIVSSYLFIPVRCSLTLNPCRCVISIRRSSRDSPFWNTIASITTSETLEPFLPHRITASSTMPRICSLRVRPVSSRMKSILSFPSCGVAAIIQLLEPRAGSTPMYTEQFSGGSWFTDLNGFRHFWIDSSENVAIADELGSCM